MAINYGLNRVRFVSPFRPARGSAPASRRSASRRWTAAPSGRLDVTVEREGADKPCLVAEWLVRYYSD